MTKKEIEEIKSLLVGLAGISNFQSTRKRVDKMLAVLENELSRLHQPTVSESDCICKTCGKKFKNGLSENLHNMEEH
jgi:hypothetical protein